MRQIDFGQDVCGNLAIAETKEWLVTNGIGGYASGTVANLLTRRYHGLLIAATQPPLGRTLLVTKFDETAQYAGQQAPLFTNRWMGGHIDPHGYRQTERFFLDGTMPVWIFAFGDAQLEKRIWMQTGANTTYVQYRLARATRPLTLKVKALINFRDHHGETHGNGWTMQIEKINNGLQVTAFEGAQSFRILCDAGIVDVQHEWVRNFDLSIERYRGLPDSDDHLFAGEFTLTLQEGETVTFMLSAEAAPNMDGQAALAERKTYDKTITGLAPGLPQQLALAAEPFIVRRNTPADPNGHSVIAGYPWFGDWGRDTMISLPGLTLATGQFDVARSILRTFAQYVEQGMLPNRFPDAGETPEYNTVDATLWYFEAVRAYFEATGDVPLLEELYPVLEEIVVCHIQGTRYHIHMDPSDGLLHAGEPGVQLTWMDAKVGEWVVTPRTGKPVEINALWYNALRSMADFAKRLGKPAHRYETRAQQVMSSFTKFWNESVAYCFDVIDGPEGPDDSLRPNQLLAVSLFHSPLPGPKQKAVVDICARHLLTSHGLRSLSPLDPAYIGHYGGNMRQRDAAYHQGTVWAWLIGPFVSAHLKVYHNPAAARSFLTPLLLQLSDHGLGSISEIFDGDAPFTPRGCFAQAWSVAELLRVYRETDDFERKATT